MHLPVYGDDGRAAMHKSHLVGKWEGFKDDTMQTCQCEARVKSSQVMASFKDDTMQTCRCEAREAQTAVDKS
tara:strand:+ start:468 stop:683 length:216 start_codon:yes stop_codon:yes gene_type:complete